MKKGKNEDMPDIELTNEVMFDIMSKKIVCMFHRHSLFTRLAITSYDGWIRGQGDSVRMIDHTVLMIDRAIPIEEECKPGIFKDMALVNVVTARIAKQIKDEVEMKIMESESESVTTKEGRLYFVCQVVPMGGFNPKGYGMKFVYGFKIV